MVPKRKKQNKTKPSRYQTVESNNYLLQPSPRMASSPWIRCGHSFLSALLFTFSQNMPSDEKSAATLKPAETLNLIYSKAFILQMKKSGGHTWRGFLPPRSAASHGGQIQGFPTPTWMFLPLIPGFKLRFELPPFSEITICFQMSLKAVQAKASPKGTGMSGSGWDSSIFPKQSRSLALGDFALQIEGILFPHKSLSGPELNVGFNWRHNFAQAQGGNFSWPQTHAWQGIETLTSTANSTPLKRSFSSICSGTMHVNVA